MGLNPSVGIYCKVVFESGGHHVWGFTKVNRRDGGSIVKFLGGVVFCACRPMLIARIGTRRLAVFGSNNKTVLHHRAVSSVEPEGLTAFYHA
jgi:hypothetical protein